MTRERFLRIATYIESLAKRPQPPWRDFIILPAQRFLKALLGTKDYEKFVNLPFPAAKDAVEVIRRKKKLSEHQYRGLIRMMNYAQICVRESKRVGNSRLENGRH